MKRVSSILAIILSLVVAVESRGQRQADNDDIITVDVRKSSYPKRELILQDFMDVEYIPLETNDEFVNQGFVLDIGKKFILVRNFIQDGNIFVYNRAGKAVRRINHKGPTSKEYTNMLWVILDEDNDEIFVSDLYTGRILVYNLHGKFKRSFNQNPNSREFYKYFNYICNYDKEHLICNDQNSNEIAFFIISKQDGSITKEIKIPFKKKELLRQTIREGSTGRSVSPASCRTMTSDNDNWMLTEFSSDTIYTFLKDYSLCPFIVRTPPVQSMDPKVFLNLNLVTNRYYFMETIKNVYDFNTNTGFPSTSFMYDRQEKNFFEYTVYNDDYSTTKREVSMKYLKQGYYENQLWRSIDAFRLVEDYEKGILKGKLKEIASKLDEEDNPVIMLVKQKK